MAMGKKPSAGRQRKMWVAAQKLPRSPGHPFYERLNQVLEKADLTLSWKGGVRGFMPTGSGARVCAPDGTSGCCCWGTSKG